MYDFTPLIKAIGDRLDYLSSKEISLKEEKEAKAIMNLLKVYQPDKQCNKTHIDLKTMIALISATSCVALVLFKSAK